MVGSYLRLYYVIHPKGDRSKLAVIEFSYAVNYEISMYVLASAKEFVYREDAQTYARELAASQGLQYVPDSDRPARVG